MRTKLAIEFQVTVGMLSVLNNLLLCRQYASYWESGDHAAWFLRDYYSKVYDE